MHFCRLDKAQLFCLCQLVIKIMMVDLKLLNIGKLTIRITGWGHIWDPGLNQSTTDPKVQFIWSGQTQVYWHLSPLIEVDSHVLKKKKKNCSRLNAILEQTVHVSKSSFKDGSKCVDPFHPLPHRHGSCGRRKRVDKHKVCCPAEDVRGCHGCFYAWKADCSDSMSVIRQVHLTS